MQDETPEISVTFIVKMPCGFYYETMREWIVSNDWRRIGNRYQAESDVGSAMHAVIMWPEGPAQQRAMQAFCQG